MVRGMGARVARLHYATLAVDDRLFMIGDAMTGGQYLSDPGVAAQMMPAAWKRSDRFQTRGEDNATKIVSVKY